MVLAGGRAAIHDPLAGISPILPATWLLRISPVAQAGTKMGRMSNCSLILTSQSGPWVRFVISCMGRWPWVRFVNLWRAPKLGLRNFRNWFSKQLAVDYPTDFRVRFRTYREVSQLRKRKSPGGSAPGCLRRIRIHERRRTADRWSMERRPERLLDLMRYNIAECFFRFPPKP
jgi:hypothetical protein